jgi:hypothetical protein
MSEASEARAVIAEEKEAEKAEQKRQRDMQKRTFSISLSGTKDVADKQIGDQVKDSHLATALKALVAAAPGNSASIAGTMESSEDFTTGKINVYGIFKTVPDPGSSRP